jgi:uncharacterized protein YjiS (DUF1127 family)
MESIIGHRATISTSGPSRAPFAGLMRWWRERRMAGALHALDDATLKDIGVYRGEIPSLARARFAEPERL